MYSARPEGLLPASSASPGGAPLTRFLRPSLPPGPAPSPGARPRSADRLDERGRSCGGAADAESASTVSPSPFSFCASHSFPRPPSAVGPGELPGAPRETQVLAPALSTGGADVRRKETETTPLFRRVPTSALGGETRLGRGWGVGEGPPTGERLDSGQVSWRRTTWTGVCGRGGEEWQLKGALGDGTVEGVGRV